MSKQHMKGSMAELLQIALSEVESLREVERATGIKHQSISMFMRGKTSLRLDLADRLAEYCGIVVTFDAKKGD